MTHSRPQSLASTARRSPQKINSLKSWIAEVGFGVMMILGICIPLQTNSANSMQLSIFEGADKLYFSLRGFSYFDEGYEKRNAFRQRVYELLAERSDQTLRKNEKLIKLEVTSRALGEANRLEDVSRHVYLQLDVKLARAGDENYVIALTYLLSRYTTGARNPGEWPRPAQFQVWTDLIVKDHINQPELPQLISTIYDESFTAFEKKIVREAK
jgi:hypothetical protein